MKIDQLPVEMLMEIFSYVPENGEVSLVNKLFYRVWCKVTDSKICLRIDRRFFECLLYNDTTCYKQLQSILTSNRQISKVEFEGTKEFQIVIGNVRRNSVISAIGKFSATIKFLKFTDVNIDPWVFNEILSLTPNIEHLNLYNLSFRTSHFHISDELNLKNLKSLSILDCGKQFVNVFICLPEGVLTELRIWDLDWSELTSVLNRQLNIKALKLENIRGDIPTNIFDKLTLESLDLVVYKINRVTISAILSKQTKLKSLTISSTRGVRERAMNTVVNLLEMGILEMNVTESRLAPFAAILTMKKLKDLKLQSDQIDNFNHLKAIVESGCTPVKIRSLEEQSEMSVGLIMELPKAASHLNIMYRRRMLFGAALDLTLHHFNFIDGLEVPTWNESAIITDISPNSNVGGLEIFDTSERLNLKPWLTILSRAYPNLRVFKLTVLHSFSLEIEPILNEFTQLISLIVRSAKELQVEDWDYVHKGESRLRFVSIRGLDGLAWNFERGE